jgi:hypothetical protein
MNIIVTSKWYSEEFCRDHPKSLFIFSDNNGSPRKGKGGQAIIRDEINAVGIATKKSTVEYFSDSEYWENIKVINEDIFKVKEKYINDMYETVVFPSQGIGTGLSAMQTICPRTFLYLCERLLDEFNYNNLSNLKSK